MAFTENEIAEHTNSLEEHFWTLHRPPLHLRKEILEGQRFTDQSIELFFVRPGFIRPGEQLEESIAKLTFVRRSDVWRLFWKRADGKWHRYPPSPEAKRLADALKLIGDDANGCFFG